MIRNLKLITQPLASQRKLAYPLASSLGSLCTNKNFSSSLGPLRCSNAIASQRRPFNQPAMLARHQSTSLSENEYEKIVAETLESLSDYFDELLENQTKIANYDLSLSVSF